jgi:L-asparaginase
MSKSILIIYTGGTIGMIEDHEHAGVLKNVNFDQIEREVPALKRFGYRLDIITFDPVIDSSGIKPENWVSLVQVIARNYEEYDGFVVLHGTDTMAYTASALSFMLEGLAKPVILTGSQIPIGVIRTDGKENLITAVEIAAAEEHGRPLVPEVCIYFESSLLRGNRTTKYSSEQFHAFESPNFQPLATAGIDIKYNRHAIRYPVKGTEAGAGTKAGTSTGAGAGTEAKAVAGTGISPFLPHTRLESNIALIKLFPGISYRVLSSILSIEGLKGVVLETYGSGNAPLDDWFISLLEDAVKRQIVILNITQCSRGSVDMGIYETGAGLSRIGVVNGFDMTTEAAVTKMMYLFGRNLPPEEVSRQLSLSLRGELQDDEEL